VGIQILPALGLINGANTAFTTPTPYSPGSLRVIHNGQLLEIDCAEEVSPSAGTWTWLDPQPPRPGDTVTVLYDDVGGAPAYIPVCPLVGVIRPTHLLRGVLVPTMQLVGSVAPTQRIVGTVRIQGGSC
jgi:hypothetical protein